MAIVFTYDESQNVATVKGGTSGTPATFADFVTADRAGTAELTPEDAPVACTTNITLTKQIRPCESRALQITFTLAGTSAGAGDTLDVTGTDWDDVAQGPESIDVSGGDGAYTGANKWRTITDIDCTGWADGTLKVTQPQWGVIWDYGDGVYRLDSALYCGGGGVATHFADTNKVIICSDFLGGGAHMFYTFNAANFTLGEVVTEGNKTTKNGCVVKYLGTANANIFNGQNSSDNTYLYSTRISGVALSYSRNRIRRIWNCTTNKLGMVLPSTSDIYNFYTEDGATGLENTAASMDKVFISSYTQAMSVSTATVLVTSSVIGGCTNLIYCVNSAGNNPTVVDLTTNTWQIVWAGSNNAGCNVYRKNTVNIHVSDKDGTDLATVAVVCEDQDGNTTGGFASVNTDANGDIAEQTIIRGYCDLNNSNLDSDLTKDYSPHKFTISKAGYETLILENITVDAPIVWHLELQPIRHPVGIWIDER